MTTAGNNLFAAVDMGTNSFKLLIVRANPINGRFFTVDRLNHPVLLGLSTTSSPSATTSLRHFKQLIDFHRIPPSNFRIVATSAVRESPDQLQFINHIRETLGLEVLVLSGVEEARLIYRGIQLFYPIQNKIVLAVDIGGGSTEFVIGKSGQIYFSTSLKLGHVTLTKQFVSKNDNENLRQYIRNVVKESGLVEFVKSCGFDAAMGSSGTIKAIEKAVFYKYGSQFSDTFDGFRSDWRFTREELRAVVESLFCGDEKETRDAFFKKRSQFIVSGAVLLEEIFGLLEIEEMEVSGYALGEGVVSEMLAEVFEGYDLNANARWGSVMRIATRFNNKKRMKAATLCAAIAKEIFEGLKKLTELHDSFDDKDLEYLEAACLLNNIGMFAGKKGYHKRSYQIIMNGDQLHGYNTEEVKLIALLARHHRKKFPKFNHGPPEGFTSEAAEKFRILCTILRLSVVLNHYMPINIEDVELSHCHNGFKLVLKGIRNQALQSADITDRDEIKKELEHLKVILKQDLTIEVLPSTSEP